MPSSPSWQDGPKSVLWFKIVLSTDLLVKVQFLPFIVCKEFRNILLVGVYTFVNLLDLLYQIILHFPSCEGACPPWRPEVKRECMHETTWWMHGWYMNACMYNVFECPTWTSPPRGPFLYPGERRPWLCMHVSCVFFVCCSYHASMYEGLHGAIMHANAWDKSSSLSGTTAFMTFTIFSSWATCMPACMHACMHAC